MPQTTAKVGVQYRQPATVFGTSGAFSGRVAYQYVGSRANDLANTFFLREYGLVNAKLGWESKILDMYAFAYDLFDKRYESSGQNFGPMAQSAFVGQGRIVGLGGTIKF